MVSGDRAAPASDCDKHYEIHLDCRWTADIVVNDQSAIPPSADRAGGFQPASTCWLSAMTENSRRNSALHL